jgi:hypothetical protein
MNERHLEYMERFVESKDRDHEFPSVPGYRQLADKFPAWLTSAKHRAEIVRTIQRLRAPLAVRRASSAAVRDASADANSFGPMHLLPSVILES